MPEKSVANNYVLPQWAPRLEPQLIRRLYLSDANGMLDEELLEEVSFGLYCRCLSIRDVTSAYDGHVACPSCRTVIDVPTNVYDREVIMQCSQCEWTCRMGDYHATFKGKDLRGHNFYPLVEEYLREQPLARTNADKMMLIDRLIHAVHRGTAKGAACSFLRGSAMQLRPILDELAYGDASTPGMMATKEQWDVEQHRYDPIWKKE